jgi:phosphoribosylamine---glycine ligase
VLVAREKNEAAAFLDRALRRREFGEGGARVLMEEALEGEELSLIVLTDGERTASMAPARDHKRILDGDRGPNTGGMGAYSTGELLPAQLAVQIENEIVRPSIRGMASDGRPYRGFLYFGLMLTSDGPKVLEFNCRMGDPEAQAIIYRMDFDLASVLAACAAGQLDPSVIRWKPSPSVCVVMASQGYPGDPQTGQSITGIKDAEALPGVKVFHAGTKKEGTIYYTTSGRVLGVTSEGPTLAVAVSNCYEAVHKIRFAGAQFRTDIARKALVQGSPACD